MPDVYDAPQLSGLGGIAIIRAGQPTEYRQSSRGITGGGLLDDAINARRNMESRRADLINQLPNANRQQYRNIVGQLRGLDMISRSMDRQEALQQRQADFEANQNRMLAHANAIEADRAIRRERDTRIDQMGADAIVRMNTLDNAFRSGQITKEVFDDGMLELGKTHFEALHRHPEASKHWAAYLDQDHKFSQYQERMNLREAAKLQARYGVQVQLNPDTGEIDFDAMHKAVLGTPKGQAEALGQLNREMIGRYGLPARAVFENAYGGTMKDTKDANTFQATDPNDTKNPQTHVRMDVLSPTGVAHSVILPKPKFDAIKAEFEPVFAAITGAGSQGQPTTPIEAGGVPASPAPVPKFQAGKTYSDAQGNRATYNQDGTWTPVNP